MTAPGDGKERYIRRYPAFREASFYRAVFELLAPSLVAGAADAPSTERPDRGAENLGDTLLPLLSRADQRLYRQ